MRFSFIVMMAALPAAVMAQSDHTAYLDRIETQVINGGCDKQIQIQPIQTTTSSKASVNASSGAFSCAGTSTSGSVTLEAPAGPIAFSGSAGNGYRAETPLAFTLSQTSSFVRSDAINGFDASVDLASGYDSACKRSTRLGPAAGGLPVGTTPSTSSISCSISWFAALDSVVEHNGFIRFRHSVYLSLSRNTAGVPNGGVSVEIRLDAIYRLSQPRITFQPSPVVLTRVGASTAPITRDVTLSNTGGHPLSWSVRATPANIQVAPQSGAAINPGGSVKLSVTGTYTGLRSIGDTPEGSVLFTSNSWNTGVLEVRLRVIPATDGVSLSAVVPAAGARIARNATFSFSADVEYVLASRSSATVALVAEDQDGAVLSASAQLPVSAGASRASLSTAEFRPGASTIRIRLRGLLLDGATRLAETAVVEYEVFDALDSISLVTPSLSPAPARDLPTDALQAFSARLTFRLGSMPQGRIALRLFDKPADGLLVRSSDFDTVRREDSGDRSLTIPAFRLPAEEKPIYLKAVLFDAIGTRVLAESEAVRYNLAAIELDLTAIRAIQVTQDAANSVPLVRGKGQVLVRAFVKQNTGPAIRNIPGVMENSITPNSILDAAPSDPDPDRLEDTLNFRYLPRALNILEDELKVTLRTPALPSPPVRLKNSPRSQLVLLEDSYQEGYTLRIGLVPICLTDKNSGDTQFQQTLRDSFQASLNFDHHRYAQYLKKLIPSAPVQIQFVDLPPYFYPKPVPLPRRPSSNAEREQEEFNKRLLINDLNAHFRYWNTLRDNPLLHGLVGLLPHTDTYSFLGTSDPEFKNGKGRIVLVVDSGARNPADVQKSVVTMTHEVLHLFGLRHTNQSLENATLFGCGVDRDKDTDWPYPNPTIQEPGFDSETGALIPRGYFDIMSYCSPEQTWISPFSYKKAGYAFFHFLVYQRDSLAPKPPAARSAEAGALLRLSGTVRRDGSTAAFASAFPAAGVPDAHDPKGDHCFAFFAQSTKLGEHCFSPPFETPDFDLEEAPFDRSLVLPAGTSRVALVRDGRELAFATSPGPPQVSIVSPAAGERWEGVRRLTWSASHPNGSPLSFRVDYSLTGGASWLPLSGETTDTELELDTTLMLAGPATFRVTAASGLDFAEARVGPVTIAHNVSLQLASPSIDFGSVTPGQSIRTGVRLRNNGTGLLSVSSIGSGSENFEILSQSSSLLIPSGAERTLEVAYNGAAGRQTGAITIVSNDPVQPRFLLPVAGTGAVPAPEISASATRLDFGNVTIGQTRDLSFTVSNRGRAELRVTALTFDNARFAIVTPAGVTAANPLVIAPAGQQNIAVRFAPQAVGAQTGALAIATNDPARPTVSVPATGAGMPVSQAAPQIAVSPQALDFGSVGVAQSAERTLQVRNTGGATLTLSGIASSNGRFTLVSPAPPLTIPTGTQQNVTIRFAPTSAGGQNGTLTVSSNDPDRPSVTVAVSGEGSASPPPPAGDVRIEIAPATLDFASLPVGQTRDLSLTVRALGNAALTVSSLAVDNPRFTVASPAATQFTIAPGATGGITVRFAPSAAGAQTATLTIRSNAANQPSLAVPLTGTGAAATGAQDLELKVDDGTFERNVGYASGAADVLFVNRLPALSYPVKLKRVRIYLPDIDDGVQLRSMVGVVVGLIASDAQLTATSVRPAKEVLVQKLGQWLDVDVAEQSVPAGTDIVVGFTVTQEARQRPAALDTSGASQSRSFGSANSGRMEPISRFTGVDGNLAIRAVVTR
ncbi:MAG: choice-of-anchor D domain-containing protein [Bryobacterales bacterium]|nr:choice-of-anchor D domain-containing protein [Bryobacterales bacterium]